MGLCPQGGAASLPCPLLEEAKEVTYLCAHPAFASLIAPCHASEVELIYGFFCMSSLLGTYLRLEINGAAQCRSAW